MSLDGHLDVAVTDDTVEFVFTVTNVDTEPIDLGVMPTTPTRDDGGRCRALTVGAWTILCEEDVTTDAWIESTAAVDIQTKR